MGVNLSPVYDWSSEWVFQDSFRIAREWMYHYRNGERPGGHEHEQLDANGWPLYLLHNQWVETLMHRGIAGRYPAGRYRCFYEGEGLITFHFDGQVLDRGDHWIDVQVRPSSNGILLRITQTENGNHLKNIRLVHEDALDSYQAQPFHPLFLERLQPYAVLRFMDWQRTNNSGLVEWKDRATPDKFTQASSRGVALEHMITLCNLSGKDPWFCIPHQANDNFVKQFALMVREKLSPERKVYIEYSNEVWNSIFAQAQYCLAQGQALQLSDNAYESQLRYYSQRAVEVFRIWSDVFSDSSRLVRVLSAQAVNPWVAHTILSWRDAHEEADAIAIAPYFGSGFGHPSNAKSTMDESLEGLLDLCEQEILSNGSRIADHSKMAKQLGLQLIAYEGGQHLSGHGGSENKTELTDRFIRANRHPRMRELYHLDHRSWSKNGGGLFMYYHSISQHTKWGSWGLLEYQDQEPREAPKYLAIQEIYRSLKDRSNDEIPEDRLLGK